MAESISIENTRPLWICDLRAAIKAALAAGFTAGYGPCTRLRSVLALFIVLFLFPTLVQAAWYDSNWSYRQKITILSTLADADLSDFPYLVKITDAANPLFADAQIDGDDILFTAADGTTKINHEIEKYDSTTKELFAWVQVPFISSTVNTDIYMYYGYGSVGSQQNVNETWDDDFVMVQHLQETSGTHIDSTSKNNDGTPLNGVVQTATGKIDGADQFDGSNDKVDVADSATLRVVDMTLEAWVYIPDSIPSSFHGIVTHAPSTSNWYGLWNNGNVFHFRWSNGTVRRTDFATTISPNNWYYVTGVLDVAGNVAITYLNGNVDRTVNDPDPPTPTAGPTYLGHTFSGSEYFKGFIDEVRISKIARSQDWIKASFRNQNSPDTYQTLDPMEPVAIADLSLTKTDNPDPAPSGGALVYNLVVTNNGPDTATGVTLTDNLPASVTLQSASPTQGSCSGTTTVTCNLGTILNGGTASVEIMVVTSGTGSINNTASVTADETDPIPANNSAAQSTEVVLDSAVTDVPLTLYQRIHGFIDYTTTGGSLRTQPNSVNPCTLTASSTANLSGIPGSATVRAAYLYWAGSGATVDSQVTLDGAPLTADRTFTSRFNLGANTYHFFGGFKDVTATVAAKGNGNYTFSNLAVDTGSPYCGSQAVLAGWSLFAIYDDTSVTGKTLVLYDGFDLERNSLTNYTLTGVYATAPPEGKTSFLIWEGDESLGGTDERLEFNSTTLSDGLNPVNNVYNNTINSIGSSTAYGVDLDTFDVSSMVSDGDTSATTTVSVGPDLAILNAVMLEVKSNVIVGYVFDDVNYGGGAGRNFAAAVAAAPGFPVGRPNATVELYDAAGNFLWSATTDANGRYGFTGIPDGNYLVRVVNDTVTAARAGGSGSEWPVQTYRTNAGTGTAVAVTNEVGGAGPAGQDDPANVTSANLFTLSAQSVAPVTLTSAAAVVDVDFGFSFDTIVNTNNDGQGSLRQVIENANALANTGMAQAGQTAGLETTIFMIPGATAHTIQPTAALPTIIDPLAVDGTTQPGWTSTPIIELTGNMAVADGLTISAGGSTIRGLVINRFTASGIDITANGSNTIVGNYIGTNAAGTAQAGNNAQGIRIANSTGNTIGGTSTADRNVISGNRQRGIRIESTSSGNQVLGNFIGTNAAGTAAITNQQIGVYLLDSPDNTIGGTVLEAGNLVSGNTWHGIYAWGPNASGNLIQGNTIGLDVTQAVAIPNGDSLNRGGITISNAPGNTIGGTATGAGNVIAGNTGRGVNIIGADATGNAIFTNAIYGNGSIGIDLGLIDGVTVNDGAKTAGEPNLLMDYPVFTAAILVGTNLFVTGYVGSAPDQATFANAQVEIFEADNDSSGYGEGQTYLGTLPADGSGNFNGTIDVSGKGLAAGEYITGTATDGSNNTSEFGEAVQVINGTDLAVDKTVDKPTPDEGETVTYTVTITNNGPYAATTIVAADALPAGVTYVSDTPSQGSYDNGSGVWTVGNLADSASVTLTISATVDAGTSGSTITNTATITALDQADPDAANNSDSIDIAIGLADLALTKTVNNPTPNELTTITYTVTLFNNGPTAATNISLIDQLPAGVTFVSSTQTQGTYNSTTGLWTIGNLANGAGATLTITATVNAGTAGNLITNTANNLSAGQSDPVPANNQDSADITVQSPLPPGTPQLDINKASDAGGVVNQGDTITYTINVTNTGTVPLSGIAVTDVLPTGSTHVPGSTQVTAPVSGTVRDEFSTAAFSNNDGSVAWATNWIEVDGNGLGATTGNVRITGGELSLDDNPNTGGYPSLERQANLSGAVSAILTFDFRRTAGVDTNDSVVLEISANGGGSWSPLEDFTGVAGANSGTRSRNISGFIAANTRIRFRVNTLYGGSDEIFFVDNVQIAYCGGSTIQSGGAPPNLASGYNLCVGEQLTVTFQVTVNNPFDDPDGTVDNNASAGSNQTASQNSNTVVDPVGIPDILVMKLMLTLSDPVNDTTNPKAIPGASVIYTIAATNQGNGPTDTNTVILTDAVPLNTALFVGDLDGSGSPLQFVDGATVSGLTYTFTSLASATDDIEFSNDDGASYTYDPGPDTDADGFNSSVTHLRVRPKGVFNGASGGNNPSFELKFKVRVE